MIKINKTFLLVMFLALSLVIYTLSLYFRNPNLAWLSKTSAYSNLNTRGKSGMTPQDAARVSPIVRITLTANTTSDGVVLEWTTEQKPVGDQHNYFTIERALDSDPWKREEIGRIKINGGFLGPYEYLDESGLEGSRYSYRIAATQFLKNSVGDVGISNDVEVIFPKVKK
jgi:hypothetical protein